MNYVSFRFLILYITIYFDYSNFLIRQIIYPDKDCIFISTAARVFMFTSSQILIITFFYYTSPISLIILFYIRYLNSAFVSLCLGMLNTYETLVAFNFIELQIIFSFNRACCTIAFSFPSTRFPQIGFSLASVCTDNILLACILSLDESVTQLKNRARNIYIIQGLSKN